MSPRPAIAVCLCTYRRPALLTRLLEGLEQQRLPAPLRFVVVVCDNDRAGSAAEVVRTFQARASLELSYTCEPEQNIALARNRVIAASDSETIAFIDDDECPEPDWLAHLWQTLHQHDASAVLGPVRPTFTVPPPGWILRGNFFARREFPTGTPLPPSSCRTGNVLFRRAILPASEPPFRREYGSGGEDVDFFVRLGQQGHRFVWCNEAPVYEVVPASRCSRAYILHRALLRGKINYRLHAGQLRPLLESCGAIPLYLLLLPFQALRGQHHFMNQAMRLCDHLGRFLAYTGLSREGQRQM